MASPVPGYALAVPGGGPKGFDIPELMGPLASTATRSGAAHTSETQPLLLPA